VEDLVATPDTWRDVSPSGLLPSPLNPNVLAMTDYSATPLSKKLGIKTGSHVLLINAHDQFVDSLAPLPDNVTFDTIDSVSAAYDVIILFVRQEVELLDRFASLASHLTPVGGLWIAYPKKSAKVPTDLIFDNVQRIGLEAGLVDNKVCAIDSVYTGLRFVIRKENRSN
jgi:hypothetical protein